MRRLAVFTLPLPSALGLGNNDALGRGSANFALDSQWKTAKAEY
jgi:hypothetical protein